MSLFSSTASLRSSILRNMEENGRKYHGYKEGKYVLPVDEVKHTKPLYIASSVSLTLCSENWTGKVGNYCGIDKTAVETDSEHSQYFNMTCVS